MVKRKTASRLVTAVSLLGITIIAASLLACGSTEPVVPANPGQVPEESFITPADSLQLPPRGFFMGILPTPGEGQSFSEAHKQASEYAEFSPVWGRPSPFYDLATELSGSWGETFMEQYIRGNGMFPIIHMSFIDDGMTLKIPSNISGATLENQRWRDAYKQAALDIVKAARPCYLSIGNEVNRWYEHHGANDGDPDGFQHYVSLYNEVYDAVKELSPETKVFCTFAREIVSENREVDLDVLKLFDAKKMDVLVFTSYPFAIKSINLPSDIPDDYFLRASDYMPGKPFGMSELGWPALDAFGGEQGQAYFLTQAAGRLTTEQGIDLHLFGWTWLHALDENDYVSLIERNGDKRMAYSAWKELSLSGK